MRHLFNQYGRASRTTLRGIKKGIETGCGGVASVAGAARLCFNPMQYENIGRLRWQA